VEREQSGETSLVESEETCVRVEEGKMLDAGTPLHRAELGLKRLFTY
jgi:hypothetical protein